MSQPPPPRRIRVGEAFIPPDVARPLEEKLERIATERPDLVKLIERLLGKEAP